MSIIILFWSDRNCHSDENISKALWLGRPPLCGRLEIGSPTACGGSIPVTIQQLCLIFEINSQFPHQLDVKIETSPFTKNRDMNTYEAQIQIKSDRIEHRIIFMKD
jgi:hypothetical protein